jgi:hypothetical protein
VASLVFGAGGPGNEAGGLWPPLASPPPCRGRGLAPALVLSFAKYGLFLYIKHAILSLWIDRQLSFFVLSLLLSTISASRTEDLSIHATCTACMHICA